MSAHNEFWDISPGCGHYSCYEKGDSLDWENVVSPSNQVTVIAHSYVVVLNLKTFNSMHNGNAILQ